MPVCFPPENPWQLGLWPWNKDPRLCGNAQPRAFVTHSGLTVW